MLHIIKKSQKNDCGTKIYITQILPTIMIIDVYKNYVFCYLVLLSRLRLLATCWTLRNGIDITDMYNIDKKYKELLTQSIIDK